MKKIVIGVVSLALLVCMCFLVLAECFPAYDLAPEFVQNDEKTFTINGDMVKIQALSVGDQVTLDVNGETVSANLCDTVTVGDIKITPIEIIGKRTTLAIEGRPVSDAVCYPPTHLKALMTEGQINSYSIEGWEYEIQAVSVSGSEVQFKVDGQLLPAQHLCAFATFHTDFKELVIVPVKFNGNGVEFTMFGTSLANVCNPESHLTDTIKSGEKKTYSIEGWEYEVTALSVAGGRAKLQVDSEVLPAMEKCQSRLVYFSGRHNLWISILSVDGSVAKFAIRADGIPVNASAPVPTNQIDEEQNDNIIVTTTPAVPGPDVEDETEKEETHAESPASTAEASSQPIAASAPECFGCLDGDVCAPIGTRFEGSVYCAVDKTRKEQVNDGENCQNNYECVSNQCYNSVCTSVEKDVKESKSFLEKIFEWFKRLFGG